MMNVTAKHGGVGHMLRLISQAKETLTEVFENGPIRETFENANDLRKLKEARVVIVTSRGYRVHPKMASLMNYFLETEESLFLGTQHAERIPEIRSLSDQYLEAKLRGKEVQEAEIFNTLEGVVYEITMDLQESCRRLRSRISYEFGYGKTLAHKRKENQVAIEQAEKLVKGMKAFSFKLLADIAGDNTDLNTLLCVEMNGAIRDCQQELGSILVLLRALMMKYRNKERDKDLINSFDRFFDLEPNWLPNDEDVLPDKLATREGEAMFWLSEPLEFAHCPDPSDPEQEEDLADIVDKITSQPSELDVLPVIKEAERRDFSLDVEIRELIEADIDSHCDSLFTSAFISKSGKEVSALEYFASVKNELSDALEPLNCAEDVWLFSVINFHVSMLPEDRKDFVVRPIGAHSFQTKDGNVGYGNLHLEDVFIVRK